MSGWIKIHRKFEKWGWRHKPEMVSLFIHMLTEANFETTEFEKITIERGQCIFGRKRWSETLGISEQSLRTCIERLKSTNEITSTSTNKFTIITIVKYEEYQQVQEETTNTSTNKLTNHQPTTNQQLTTPKESKNKRIKERYTPLPLKKDFEEVWEVYPRHDDKAAAEKAYLKARKLASLETIYNAVVDVADAFDEDNREKREKLKYCKLFSTWLNKECWKDYPQNEAQLALIPRSPDPPDHPPNLNVVR